MAGTNDVLTKTDLKPELILNLQKSLNNTNVYVVSVPVLNVKPAYNTAINRFNTTMREIIFKMGSGNFKFIDLCNVLRIRDITLHNIHLANAEKRKIMYHIYRNMITNTATENNKNFRFPHLFCPAT